MTDPRLTARRVRGRALFLPIAIPSLAERVPVFLGLLATAGIFIAKFWKIGLLAMAGLGAGAGTWLERKKNSD